MRPHDLGGSFDFGAVDVSDDGAPFHHEWEARVFAINRVLLARGIYTLDEFRYAVEQMEPDTYHAASYYERWLYAIQKLLADKGLHGTAVEPGAKVRTLEQKANRHTRLPGYLQRKPATVVAFIGVFPLPDDAAVDPKLAHQSELYTLEFDSGDVWGIAETDGQIRADIFEDYMESAE